MFIPLFLAVVLLGQANDLAPEWDPTDEPAVIATGDATVQIRTVNLGPYSEGSLWDQLLDLLWLLGVPTWDQIVPNQVHDPDEAPTWDPTRLTDWQGRTVHLPDESFDTDVFPGDDDQEMRRDANTGSLDASTEWKTLPSGGRINSSPSQPKKDRSGSLIIIIAMVIILLGTLSQRRR